MFKYLRIVLPVGTKLLKVNSRIKKILKHPENTPMAEKYSLVRDAFIYLGKKFRVDCSVKGIENLRTLEEKGKPFYIVSNHMGDFDSVVILSCVEKPTTPISKIEMDKTPVIGNAIRMLEGYYLVRDDLRQSVEMMRNVTNGLKNKDMNILIFPEGTRNRNPEHSGPAPFHPGSMRPAIDAGATILPVAVYGTFRVLNPWHDYRRNPVEVSFLPPITPEQYAGKKSQELAIEVNRLIKEEVDLHKQADREFFKGKKHKISLRKGQLEGRTNL